MHILIVLGIIFIASAFAVAVSTIFLQIAGRDKIITLGLIFVMCRVPPMNPYLDVADIARKENMTLPERKTYPKKIECVTVCVGYADFLRATLPFNKNHFDRFVVVTSSADLETQCLCEYWHVECVVTDVFYENGDVFNKAKGINEGLKRLALDGWVLHLDADIYLPPRTREILNLIPLCEKSIYSIDRANLIGFPDWMKYLCKPAQTHGRDGLMRLEQFPIGSRLLNLDRDGYVPIGYFQLWNARASGVKSYPDSHGAADRTDTLFAYNWTREHRHLIPELSCVHIESEPCPMGANWQGRKTARFEHHS